MLLVAFAAILGLPLQAEAQTGVCGRTEQVRDEILDEISGVTDCADVTDAHLAAITGTLSLDREGITALAAGDFDGLTKLNVLELRLNDNPGAPFSPTADALPDDGEVSPAGGDVTLDGSGSGGPWGANVTYRWRQTSGPTSGVTFDDAASATPVVTIPALAEGAELITVTAVPSGAAGTAPDTDAATVTAAFDPTAGICGRTKAVRDAIVALVSGAINCALVTDAHLGAITDTLNLESQGITALAAGDFDGLTALTTLSLANNSLSTLPAGVFDELTALTTLGLYDNSLSTLPAGVFDKLTALTQLGLAANSLTTLPAGVFDELTSLRVLYLHDNSLTTLDDDVFDELISLTRLSLSNNSLTTLDDDVFEELTALTTLYLSRNPGAPFSPTADALPDDGTVSSAGGTVTLDGSGSGGPWGANVTYSWALTSPASGVTVTFDDAASATPVVTIPALTDGAELTFTVPDTDAATVTVTAPAPNAAPSFDSPETFNAPENQTAVGTVQASDSDTDDSVTGYAIHGGADGSKFSIDAATGALTFASPPNFEAPSDADTGNDYVVVVRATSGAGARAKTAEQTITVTVTNVGGEAPGVPVEPTVSPASATSLNVSWTAPANAGPPITDYDYRYGVASSGPWTEVTGTTILALEATIAPLAEDTEYYVQVRATNDEGTGDWSAPGSGSTDANAAPSFDSPATFNAAENQAAVGTVAASDSDTGDSVTGYAIHGGADLSKFSIDAATGVLTFASPPNFEAASDADTGNDYVVVVRATSGAGARAKTAEQTITVTVTNVGGEAPGVPVEPTVSSASATSLNVSWTAPANAGPPITDYDYRYGVASSGPWTEVTNTTITALEATIAPLAEDTEYDVQVRARNDEGTSGWSDPGTGTPTGSTEAGAIANAPENLQATAGDAEATLRWDAPNNDSGADITGYAYRYKESGGDFIAYTDIPESGPGEANARSYTVTELTNGLEYVFHVRALNEHGGGLPAEATVTLPGIVSSESEELPAEVMLSANYPNPFNPETTIRYALPQAGQVRLVVYDLLGHEVAVLVDGLQSAGDHTVRFGAGDLPSGAYVYRLQAQGKTIVRTMILVK